MADNANIKLEIEIEIKQEIEDVYIKEEPFEETTTSGDNKDFGTESCGNFRDIRDVKTLTLKNVKELAIKPEDFKDLQIIPFKYHKKKYLSHAIKKEPAEGPALFQKCNVYPASNQSCNEHKEVKPFVQEIINQIQNRVSKVNSEQVTAKLYTFKEDKSKLKQKRPVKLSGPYFCEFCHKEFQHISKLKRHIHVHTGQRPYICHICGKQFGESSYLKLHMLMHKGEKVFACQLCDKRFTHGSNLKRHQLTHTGERPFICEVCKKGYSDRSTLKQHRRIHDGEKPYVCEVCNQGFPQSSQLKKHIMKHDAQPLFSNL